MLTPQEQALIAEIRANAAATGEDDGRTKSQLRRGQRRLLAIIDRLTDEPKQTATTARKAIEVCHLIAKWSERVFCSGFGLVLKNGCPVDHTELNDAWRLAQEVLGKPKRGPRHPIYFLDESRYIVPDANDILKELLCDDCPPPNQYTDGVRCATCPRRSIGREKCAG